MRFIPGIVKGIGFVINVFVKEDEKVIIQPPVYHPFRLTPEGNRRQVVYNPLRENADGSYSMDFDNLAEVADEKCRLLILSNPHNPAGITWDTETLRRLADFCSERNIIVISDEIDSELTYTEEGHTSIASLPGMHERTIVLNGFSKAFAMTGWRMGYLCAPAAFTDVMCKIHQYTILCAPRQGQVAAEEALRQGREDGYADVVSMRESYNQRRRLMVQSFRDMGLSCFEPLGAFYCFPSIQSTGMSSEEFCQRLLQEKKVAIVPGDAFGACGGQADQRSFARVRIVQIKQRFFAFFRSSQQAHDFYRRPSDRIIGIRFGTQRHLRNRRKVIHLFNAV